MIRAAAVLALLAVATPTRAADPAASVTADRKDVRLSESVRVTLTIDGAAPLRVELPADPLDESAAANWRVRPAGPAAVTDLPGGRQRWTQVYRADPYVPGDAVRLAFTPAKVSAGGDPQPKPATWPAVDVTVTTEVTGDPSEVRPPTGIEQLPSPPPESLSHTSALAAFGTLGGAVAVIVTAAWLRRRLRRAPVPTPAESARDALAAAGRDRAAGALSAAAFADRVADAVRAFVQRRTGLPAGRLTTAELLAAEPVSAWDAPPADDLRAVLGACDRMRFAGAEPPAVECDEVLATARRFVGRFAGPSQPR